MAQAQRVPTARVARGAITTRVTASGSIVARRATGIGPEVPGRILKVHVDVGDRVDAGDPLFEIDAESYRIGLEAAKAGLALARAQSAQADQESERARRLSEQSIVAEQQYDRMRTQAAVARAQVQQAQANLRRVRHDLARTVVRAPYAGSIVERRIHEGTMATVRPNTVVLILQESGALEAVLDIPEAVPAPVRTNDAVRLFVEGLAEPLEGRVRAVSDRIDPQSRTYRIRVPVTDPSGTLKGGAFVRAEVEPSARENALLVEPSAVHTRDGRSYVVRVSDGVAERIPVRLGVVAPERTEILSGVAEGDRVVIGETASRLADGARVEADGGNPSAHPVSAVSAGAEGRGNDAR
jgi:RND family efflux transporter MFP subunit